MKRGAPLSDRLFADFVASPLILAAKFRAGHSSLSLKEMTEWALIRGKVYAKDLCASPADLKYGLEDAYQRWLNEVLGLSAADPLPEESTQYRAVRHLFDAARSLLQSDGSKITLKVDRAERGRGILRWRFVSLAMPAEILVAATSPRSSDPSAAVRLLRSSMAPTGAVAHQHLHHAAMMSFEELWSSLRLRALLQPGDFQRSLRGKHALCPRLHTGACRRGHSKEEKEWAGKHQEESAKHMAEWGDALLSAFIARGLLDRHAGHADRLNECSEPGCTKGRATLEWFLQGNGRPYSFTGTPYPWPNDRFRLGRLYWDANAEGVFRNSQKKRRTFIRNQTAEERSILARAFDHVRPTEEPARDSLYEILLLQYLRVKTALHRLLVHPPGEHGLEKFLDHFSQIKVYEPRSDRLRPGKPDEPGLTVAATEYRVAPDAWLAQIGRGERDHRGRRRTIEELFPGEKAGEAAWLIHFKRKEHRKEFLPLHGRAIREMEGEARRIGNALEQDPKRLRRLRGIDICGVEEQQPLWVCAEILRKLRARSSMIAGSRPWLKLQPLRLTLHAGEDFRWLTSGMRAVAEPFHWHLIVRGDRIGHGIAVTLEPEGWWKNHQHSEPIKRKRIDRLQDLAFLAVYTDPHPLRFQERTPEENDWLGRQVAEVIDELGLGAISKSARKVDLVAEAKAFWTTIGGRAGRRLLDQATQPADDAPLHEHWIYRYFWNLGVQNRADSKVPIQSDDTTWTERDLLINARRRLIRELARWQIPIESNPSSNLVVASLDTMMCQELFVLPMAQGRGPGKETLPWTISTDDPITFATSLADEYAYAWAGMVLREKDPYDPAHARALLDQAAATSMRTRFTVPNDDG